MKLRTAAAGRGSRALLVTQLLFIGAAHRRGLERLSSYNSHLLFPLTASPGEPALPGLVGLAHLWGRYIGPWFWGAVLAQEVKFWPVLGPGPFSELHPHSTPFRSRSLPRGSPPSAPSPRRQVGWWSSWWGGGGRGEGDASEGLALERQLDSPAPTELARQEGLSCAHRRPADATPNV